MDQPKEITLGEFLRRPNPDVKIVEAPSLSPEEMGKKKNENPSTRNSAWETPKATRKWANFNLEAFNFLYRESPLQQILGLTKDFNDYGTIPEYPFCEIWDEDCLEALVIKSNQTIVNDALDFAQTHKKGQNSHGRISVSVSDP